MNLENKIPNDWVETTLGEVSVYINRGITPKYSEQKGIYILNQRCIRNHKVSFENARLNDLELRKVSVDKTIKLWDILICSTGTGTLGRVAQIIQIEKPSTVDSHVTIVRPSEHIYKPFLGHLLRGKEREIEHLAEGSTGQTELPRRKLDVFPLIIPKNIEEQVAIAKTLTAFDDKIENLQAQNNTLETTAQTIFKEWFGKYQIGDELPEGWRVGKLGEIANLKSGYAFKSKDFIDTSNFKALKIKDLKGNGVVNVSDVSSINEECTKIERVQFFKLIKGDIVLAMSGNTTGKIGVVPPHKIAIYLNQRVGKFFLKDENIKSYLYNFLMSGYYEDKILSMGYGSAQPNINPSQIENIDIIYPEKVKLQEYLNISNPIYDKVLINNQQIQTLKKTRDTLLPKLMNGSLRVKI
ncbi:restriction endonuclease subunit S [Tenacibaculum dicentrarchi]|uniref:restriction endonuclease subunit S n=1 Tax=Tenacibaculum dicentrarchi TaxID=669041 RepID=UPI003519890E